MNRDLKPVATDAIVQCDLDRRRDGALIGIVDLPTADRYHERMPLDDEVTLTAYHESGHAVIAYALGGHVASIQLGGEADDWLPERFGDCRIDWGQVDPRLNWQRQREVLTILAGPVAEMVYRSEPLHPAHYGPWQADWHHAWTISETLVIHPQQRTELLESLIRKLYRTIESEPCWSAIAALADELETHEFLDEPTIAETIGFWFRNAM